MSGTDYNYDEQGQFFPYFILTVTTLVTVPTTISFLRPSKELENTGARIESDFTPEHADLIQGQRKKQKRLERRIKRGLVMLGGWALNAAMVYLILVTARTTPDIWDPYEVLGVSRVRWPPLATRTFDNDANLQIRMRTRRRLRNITDDSLLLCIPTKPARTPQRTLRHNPSTITG
jgi:hypothetical protein